MYLLKPSAMFLLSREGSETITFLWPKWCKRLIQRFPIIPAPRTRILESAVTEPVFCNLFQSMSCGTISATCKFQQVLCNFKENVLAPFCKHKSRASSREDFKICGTDCATQNWLQLML